MPCSRSSKHYIIIIRRYTRPILYSIISVKIRFFAGDTADDRDYCIIIIIIIRTRIRSKGLPQLLLWRISYNCSRWHRCEVKTRARTDVLTVNYTRCPADIVPIINTPRAHATYKLLLKRTSCSCIILYSVSPTAEVPRGSSGCSARSQ